MFSTDLLPNGPYSWTLAAMLAVAILLSQISSDRRELLPVSLVMIGNWLFVQAASDTGHIGLAAVGASCGGVLLALWRYEVSVAIAVLFVPRLVIYASHPFLGLPLFWMWELNNVVFILQVTILVGGSMHGTRWILGRSFDFVSGGFRRVVPIPAYWREVCAALGPVHKINRHPFQEKDLNHG